MEERCLNLEGKVREINQYYGKAEAPDFQDPDRIREYMIRAARDIEKRCEEEVKEYFNQQY